MRPMGRQVSRYGLKSALAATRGARTTISRADRRYAKNFAVANRLFLALAAVNAAERQLRLAVRDALAGGTRRRAA
jgi:hypothetical protein